MKWISVNDRLPEEGSRVLAYGGATCGSCPSAPEVREARYGGRRDDFEFGEYDCPMKATHWMPLPDPPIEPEV